MSSAQSNRDAVAGFGFRLRPLGFTGSSAMNSAHERIVLLADNGRTAYSARLLRDRLHCLIIYTLYEGTSRSEFWNPFYGRML